MGEQNMNNNEVKTTNTALSNTVKDDEKVRATFIRKPDLTYDFERVLAKLNIEVEIYN